MALSVPCGIHCFSLSSIPNSDDTSGLILSHRAKVVACFNHLFARLQAVVKPVHVPVALLRRRGAIYRAANFQPRTPNRSDVATGLLRFSGVSTGHQVGETTNSGFCA